jgi:hypothetical protein
MTEETKNAESGSWDDVAKTSGDNNNNNDKKTEWMTFPNEGKYQIRLVGKFVEFYRHWEPFGRGTRLITHPDYKTQDPAWKAGFYPRKTYAIHVIDRADGKLKVLEKGKGIFEHFATWKADNDINPAGKEGHDFIITVEWPNGNKRQARYSVNAKAKPSPLTPEELKMANDNKSPLAEIYKTTPLEKIIEEWEKLPDDVKVKEKKTEDKPKEEVKAEEPEETPDTSDASEEEDVFGDDSDTDW